MSATDIAQSILLVALVIVAVAGWGWRTDLHSVLSDLRARDEVREGTREAREKVLHARIDRLHEAHGAQRRRLYVLERAAENKGPGPAANKTTILPAPKLWIAGSPVGEPPERRILRNTAHCRVKVNTIESDLERAMSLLDAKLDTIYKQLDRIEFIHRGLTVATGSNERSRKPKPSRPKPTKKPAARRS